MVNILKIEIICKLAGKVWDIWIIKKKKKPLRVNSLHSNDDEQKLDRYSRCSDIISNAEPMAYCRCKEQTDAGQSLKQLPMVPLHWKTWGCWLMMIVAKQMIHWSEAINYKASPQGHGTVKRGGSIFYWDKFNSEFRKKSEQTALSWMQIKSLPSQMEYIFSVRSILQGKHNRIAGLNW